MYVTVYINGTNSDPKFQTSLFSEPPDFFFFLHIQEDIIYNKLHVEQFSRKQHRPFIGKTHNFLLLGINYRPRK